MKDSAQTTTTAPSLEGERKISGLRWWIGVLLFASTVINYIDRQTLALLAPYLKQDYHWTNTDYANLVIGFRVAYSGGANPLWQADGSHGDQARTDSRRVVVFAGLDSYFA